MAGQQIPKSPFEVNVDKALGDASKVTVKGPGIEPLGNVASKPAYFDIYTAGEKPWTLLLLLRLLKAERRVRGSWFGHLDQEVFLCRGRYRRRDGHDRRPSGQPEQRGRDDGG